MTQDSPVASHGANERGERRYLPSATRGRRCRPWIAVAKRDPVSLSSRAIRFVRQCDIDLSNVSASIYGTQYPEDAHEQPVQDGLDPLEFLSRLVGDKGRAMNKCVARVGSASTSP
jgi:hypothetical protein